MNHSRIRSGVLAALLVLGCLISFLAIPEPQYGVAMTDRQLVPGVLFTLLLFLALGSLIYALIGD